MPSRVNEGVTPLFDPQTSCRPVSRYMADKLYEVWGLNRKSRVNCRLHSKLDKYQVSYKSKINIMSE